MKKSRLINAQLSEAVARLGHGQALTIPVTIEDA